MKKAISLLVAMLMLLSLVAGAFAAEDVTSDTEVQDTETVSQDDLETVEVNGEEAGVTPDSLLWGLERAIERVSLALTFNKAKKVNKRLTYAKERLLEVKEMTEKGKPEEAGKAAQAHAEDMQEAEKELAEVVEEEGETEEVKSLENKFERHIQVLERVQKKLQEKGVDAPGIQIALNNAKAKRNIAQAREQLKEARKAGEGVEGAKEQVREEKKSREQAKEKIKSKFVQKGSDEEETESEEPEQTEGETEDASKETSEEKPQAGNSPA